MNAIEKPTCLAKARRIRRQIERVLVKLEAHETVFKRHVLGHCDQNIWTTQIIILEPTKTNFSNYKVV